MKPGVDWYQIIDNAPPQNKNHIMEQKDYHHIMSNKLKVLTWNLWAIPFAPRTISNPYRCANFLSDIANQENWQNFDGLILCGFQEIWSWKTGIFPSFILSYFVYYIEFIPCKIGHIISIIFQFIALLIGLLLKFLPLSYDPKKSFYKRLKHSLPYSYYNKYIPFCRILDNGLLLLSNKQATQFGCEAYVCCACLDSIAYKGFVWVYFEQYNLLAITTHLQYSKSGKDTIEQIIELKTFIDKFIENKNNANNKINIIIFGDFNVDLTNFQKNMSEDDKQMSFMTECDIEMKLGNGIKKINSYEPTMITKKWGCLDHIFVNFEIGNVKENMYEKLSDHLLIVNSFEMQGDIN
eukprot:173218_1